MKGSPVRVRLSAHSIQGAQRRSSMACRESERHAETTAFQRAVCIVTCNTGSGVSESMAVHYLSLLLSGKSIAGHRIAVLCVKSIALNIRTITGYNTAILGTPHIFAPCLYARSPTCQERSACRLSRKPRLVNSRSKTVWSSVSQRHGNVGETERQKNPTFRKWRTGFLLSFICVSLYQAHLLPGRHPNT